MRRNRPSGAAGGTTLIGRLVPLAMTVAALVVALLDPAPLQALRNVTFDHYQRWHAQPYRPAPVRVVDIDQESLERLGQWPWPRTRLAGMVDSLAEAGAAVVAFDMLFAEPDRTSPTAMLATWNADAPMRAALAGLPDHDALFAAALASHPSVLAHALQPAGSLSPSLDLSFVVIERGGDPRPFLHGFGGAVAALQPLQGAARGNGAINFVPDGDGVIRRIPVMLRLGDDIVPAFFAETLRVAQDAAGFAVTSSAEAGAGIESVAIGPLRLPTSREGEMWVRYTHGGEAQRSVPAWRVFAGEFRPGDFTGAIVLVGSSAEGLLDLRFSPLGGVVPGVQVHAMALEQALAGDPISRPNWAPGAEASVIALGGLLVGYAALSLGALVSAGLFLAAAAALGWSGWLAYSTHGLLLDPVTPGVALLLVFLVAGLYHHHVSELRQRWIKQAFSRYVSPNLVEHLVRDPAQLELGGTRRECSFLFTDLAGFTALMERLDPAEAVALLNDYLDNMIRIAFAHEGTLDRIVGDAVAILFSAPVDQPDHRARALRCAADMHRFATGFATAAQARGIPFGKTRIGIHSGEVTVGNFGGSTIFDYRALGDPVNTAARLESINKQLGTTVCVSEAVLGADATLPVRPVGQLVLKGKSLPLRAYEPLFAAPAAATQTLEAYRAAYARMADGDATALDAFEQLVARDPEDGLARFHRDRLAAGAGGERVRFARK
jgi:adenylate cyclase